MKIKEAAHQLNTTPRTIRYYEEKGLIKPEKKENEYRDYGKKDMEALRYILALREFGFSTYQIKKTLQNQASVKDFLSQQRSELYREWLEVKDVIKTLDEWMDGNKSQNIFHVTTELKELKQKRRHWEDQWNFDKQAEGYDSNIKMNGYRFNVHEFYNEILNRTFERISPHKEEIGLDIGIGTGNLGSKFLGRTAKVIGVDQSLEMLKICHEKHLDIETRHGHFLALPLLDHSCDFVVTSYALHHVKEPEKELAIEEMDRVLSEGGRLVIADLMFENKHKKEQVLKAFEEDRNFEAVEAILDEHYGDRDHLVQTLTNRGYQVEVEKFSDILHLIYAIKEPVINK